MELSVDATVAVDIASKEDLERHHKWIRDRLTRPEARYRVLRSGVAVGAGPLLIDYGQAPAGHVYAPQWIAVFADNPFGVTIASVTAAVFVGVPRGSGGSNVSYSIDDVVMPGLPVPQSTSVPDKVICRGGQHIFVILAGTGLAAGATVGYNANVGVILADDDPSVYAWI